MFGTESFMSSFQYLIPFNSLISSDDIFRIVPREEWILSCDYFATSKIEVKISWVVFRFQVKFCRFCCNLVIICFSWWCVWKKKSDNIRLSFCFPVYRNQYLTCVILNRGTWGNLEKWERMKKCNSKIWNITFNSSIEVSYFFSFPG